MVLAIGEGGGNDTWPSSWSLRSVRSTRWRWAAPSPEPWTARSRRRYSSCSWCRLLVSGAIGIGVIVKLGNQSAARVLFVALAGGILIPGGIFLLFFTSMGLGTGCLN